MNYRQIAFVLLFSASMIFLSCSKEDAGESDPYTAIKAAFGNNILPENVDNYAGQEIPFYITKDNGIANPINNKKATVGRVLFYDKELSFNKTVSCASCHKQNFSFGDTALVSTGVEGGVTVRHSMRLVNARFASENKFFWNERAASLESQTTMPIKDHAEMGFSGTNGRPDFSALLSRLGSINYYKELFQFAYGDNAVSEVRIQECLAQFIRSIQSFDAKYDAGRTLVSSDTLPFPNFTAQENNGKQLFLSAPIFDQSSNRIGGGLGCGSCHRAPEFDIDPNTGNNGIIGIINNTGIDIANTRAPSLRNLSKANGELNGPMMHTGVITSLRAAVGHYGTINIAPGNNNLDNRLRPNGIGQKLNLTAAEVNAVLAFMQTLAGSAVYTDKKWSNPFQ